MPLYEYECEAENGRRFEIIQKFSDEPLTVCPTCGGKVRRLISSPAIQFKGSGWYITDYAKKSGSDAGKKSETKSESKAESKGESKAETSSSTSSDTYSPSSTSTPTTSKT